MKPIDQLGDSGGAYDITADEVLVQGDASLASGPTGPTGTTGTISSASPALPSGATPPDIRPGDIVSPADRENLGEVLSVQGATALVRFVNKKAGGTSDLWFPIAALVLLRRPGKQRQLRVLEFDELMALQPPQELVEGVLRVGELAVIYGPSGCGKSFFVLSLSLCVAAGVPWFGRPVQSGPVLYIAGEGLYGLPGRITAWSSPFDRSAQSGAEMAFKANMRVLGAGVSFWHPEQFERLLALVLGLPEPPVAIVVDTLARCMAGGDENSAKDMGLFVQNCDRLREETGAAVIVIHHSGKAEKGERGSSALRGAADTMIELAPESPGYIKVICSKQKEDGQFKDLSLRMNTVTVAMYGGGKDRQSCYLSPVEPWTEAVTVHSDLGDAVLQICRTLRDSFFEDGATGPELLKASGIKRASYYANLRAAVDLGYVQRSGKDRFFRYRLTAKFKEPAVHSVHRSPGQSADCASGESTSPPVPAPLKGPDGETGPDGEHADAGEREPAQGAK